MRTSMLSPADRVCGYGKLLLLKMLAGISVLPLHGRYWITDLLAVLAYVCMPARRAAVRKNLGLLKGTEPGVKEVCAVFREYGRYWAELPAISDLWHRLPKEYLGDYPPTEQCFVGLTFHVGNFELFGEDMYQKTRREFAVVVERLRPAFLSDYFRRLRSRHHVVSIPHDDLRGILTALKNGTPLGIACDRVIAGRGMASAVLGLTVAMPLNIIKYCLKNQVPVYVSYVVNVDGRIRMVGRKMPPGCGLAAAAAIVAEVFEEAVRRYPTHWHLMTALESATYTPVPAD